MKGKWGDSPSPLQAPHDRRVIRANQSFVNANLGFHHQRLKLGSRVHTRIIEVAEGVEVRGGNKVYSEVIV